MGKLESFLRAACIFVQRLPKALRGRSSVIFIRFQKSKYPNAQETQTKPKSPHDHGFKQF